VCLAALHGTDGQIRLTPADIPSVERAGPVARASHQPCPTLTRPPLRLAQQPHTGVHLAGDDREVVEVHFAFAGLSVQIGNRLPVTICEEDVLRLKGIAHSCPVLEQTFIQRTGVRPSPSAFIHHAQHIARCPGRQRIQRQHFTSSLLPSIIRPGAFARARAINHAHRQHVISSHRQRPPSTVRKANAPLESGA